MNRDETKQLKYFPLDIVTPFYKYAYTYMLLFVSIKNR